MTQLNATSFDKYVQLVTVDLRAFGDQVYGFMDASTFQAALPELSTIIWQGQEYQPLPFITNGWQRGGENLVRPKISLPDFGAAMYLTLIKYNLATGAAITRYQALGDDLLSNNPQATFSEEQYLLNAAAFDGSQLDLELATHLDFQRAQFPRHVMLTDEYPGLGAYNVR